MKTKPITKRAALEPVIHLGKILIEEEDAGIGVSGFRSSSLDRKERRIFWRRAALVQAAYDSAPAGAEAIAAAVWRKLQSFRPKLTAWEMDELISSKFRVDVNGILFGKVSKIREQARQIAYAADDARRAQRTAQQARTKRARKGGAK